MNFTDGQPPPLKDRKGGQVLWRGTVGAQPGGAEGRRTVGGGQLSLPGAEWGRGLGKKLEGCLDHVWVALHFGG